jgi:hypothetical protein
MVKVVSEGPVLTKKVICRNCGYELEFTGEDVHSWTDSDGDLYQRIMCPREKCAKQISVKWP